MNVVLSEPLHSDRQDVSFSFWSEGAQSLGLADDVFAVTAFSADEAVGGLTRAEVSLVSLNGEIDLSALIDRKATLSIHHKYLEAPRHFSGVVASIARGDEGHRRTAYHIVLLPILHRLDHGSDSRIFQNVSVPDIIRTVLKECGVEDVQWQLSGKHLAREFCVQYRETHLAFIERIAAEEGIWYAFSHGARGQHTLIFCDTPEALADCPHQAELTYNAMASGAVKGVYCSSLSYREQLRSTSYTQRDYTFKNPAYAQEHRETGTELGGVSNSYRLYDYPGRYKEDAAGKPFTRHKLEATRVEASLGHGIANAPHLIAGFGVKLTEHNRDSLNIRWRLLSVHHEGRQPQALIEDGFGGIGEGEATGGTRATLAGAAGSLDDPFGARLAGAAYGLKGSQAPGRHGSSTGISGGVGGEAADATLYTASFVAQPARLPYRPPQRVKPLVDGPQMAHVVGPPGEEIFTDEHGRVKLQFIWDRHGRSDDKSSCWVRVAQNWAGATWGHMAIPRIGQEVIVDFLEGDPDQPIIIGRTYHARNKPPYKLPEHKTKMVIRSDTHKGNGFNEISFEDENGREDMFIHAQKDQTIKVLHNRSKRVNANQVESIGENKSIEIGGNHQEKIGGSMNLSIGGGSGAALLGALGAIVAAGGKDSEIGSSAVGDALLTQFAGGISGVGAAAEAMALGANGAFNSAGNHRTEAGKSLAGTGGSLGSLLSGLMPISGVLTTVVEKFQSDTVGIARTEQIGAYKNTTVGHTMTINVGNEFIIKVGKSRFIMDKEGNVTITGTKFNFAAEGPVQINGKVVDLN